MAHMQTVARKVNTYNEAKNLFDLSYNMSPKAGVWVPSVL